MAADKGDERGFVEIVGRSLACATITGVLFIIVAAVSPEGLGGRVSSLGEFYLTCLTFWIGLSVAFLLQIRRVGALPMWGTPSKERESWTLPVLLAVVVAWSVGILLSVGTSLVVVWGFFAFLFGSSTADMDRTTRMEHAPPLTAAEAQSLAATHFDLTAAVDTGTDVPTQWDFLILALDETDLFDAVVASGQAANPDLMVVRTSDHLGERRGQAFTIATAENPNDPVPINVSYYPVPWWGYDADDRQQYLDRLALEVIKAVDQLIDQPGPRRQ